MKENISLSNLGTVALHAAKVPTNVFSSTLICILTLDYHCYHTQSIDVDEHSDHKLNI